MNGKDKCNLLREIRKRIAAQYGLTYQPTECHHEGDCAGTCPKCDAELQDLQRQLKEKGIENIELDRQMEEMVDSFNPGSDTDNELIALQGEAAPPEYDNKIEVIKSVRQLKGLGLKESKDFVDTIVGKEEIFEDFDQANELYNSYSQVGLKVTLTEIV